MVGVSYMIIVVCYLGRFVETGNEFPTKCSYLNMYYDCSNKNFTHIPNIPEWVRQLNMNNNNIKGISSEIRKTLVKLEDLKLNRNKIQKLNKMFDNMTQLKTLELNRNQIQTIEAMTFKALENLHALKLRRNRIHSLPDAAFFGLIAMKTLLLDNNLVETVRKGWLYELTNLKQLSLSHNVIYHIDTDAWEFSKGLIELDLSYNRMPSIKRDTFKYLFDLQKLYLNSNNISFIEENAFLHTPNLKVLNLSNNKISWAIEDSNSVFNGLANLNKLFIAYNGIKSINKNAFFGLNNVTYIDLDNNNITSIQKNPFTHLPYLEDLKLNTNTLLCDCNLQWFYEYLNLKKLNVTTNCAYPEWLRGVALLNIPANNFTCDDLPKPRLIEEPGVEIMALKGESISLTCKAMSSSPSQMSFQWKKDNVELHKVDINITVSETTDGKHTESISILNITKVKHSDAGKYQCVVTNSFGTTYSQKSSISVLIYPTFHKMPSNITVQAGTTARLECSATGEPQPEIAWQKDGGNDFPAARERRMQVMPQDDVFFIVNAKPSDMGVYSCTAHNAAGTIVANATLTIEEKPSFVKLMENKEVTEGESVVIQCLANGVPKPTVQWLKDGIPIMATERHFFTAEEELMIIVDTVKSDGGNYTCKLNNSLGTETGFCTLIVKPVIMSYSDELGIIIITVVSCAVFTSGVWVVIIYQTRRRMGPIKTNKPPTPMMIEFTDKVITQFNDNTSEHSSCKDSGTGDSAKRSNDDLLPGDEYTLIINETNPGDKSTTMRAASLIYLAAEGNASHTPLLHQDNPPVYTRSTNHDRLDENREEDLNAITTDDTGKD